MSSPALVHHFSPCNSKNLGHDQSSSNLYQIHMCRTLTSGNNLRPQNRFLLSHSVSHSAVSDSLRPTRLLCPWDSPDKNTGVGGHSLLQGNLPNPGIERRSLALQADSLPSEPPGKPPFQQHQHSSALAGTEQADHL